MAQHHSFVRNYRQCLQHVECSNGEIQAAGPIIVRVSSQLIHAKSVVERPNYLQRPENPIFVIVANVAQGFANKRNKNPINTASGPFDTHCASQDRPGRDAEHILDVRAAPAELGSRLTARSDVVVVYSALLVSASQSVSAPAALRAARDLPVSLPEKLDAVN